MITLGDDAWVWFGRSLSPWPGGVALLGGAAAVARRAGGAEVGRCVVVPVADVINLGGYPDAAASALDAALAVVAVEDSSTDG